MPPVTPASSSVVYTGPIPDSPFDKPADQVVRGVTYRPIWSAGSQTWDYQDVVGRSLHSTTVEGTSDPANANCGGDQGMSPVAQFWSGMAAAGVQERAKKLSDDAVAKLLKEQGPTLRKLETQISDIRRSGFAEREAHRIEALKAQRQEILDAYDPSIPRQSELPKFSGTYVPLPHSTSVVALEGPHRLSPKLMDPHQNAKYAEDIVPDKGTRFGKYAGVEWKHDAVRSSVGDAYAYNIETDMFQVANDLDRIAKAGYTEIHIATGTHGDEVGGLDPERKFLRQDARSIHETMQRHPGLKIIPYNMADPVQVAKFDALQALAADGKLPGGATVAAHCFSRTRVPDPNQAPAGPYATTEVLDARAPLHPRLMQGGLSIGFGALSIHSGLNDPNPAIGALKVVGGGAQVVGGAAYAAGYAADSVAAVRFGSKVGAAGGYLTAPLGLVDLHRELQHKFKPGVQPMKGEEAVYHGIDSTLKLAGMFYPAAAIGALAVEYGAKPAAAKASEYLTPKFIGGISEAYGIPSHHVWGMR